MEKLQERVYVSRKTLARLKLYAQMPICCFFQRLDREQLAQDQRELCSEQEAPSVEGKDKTDYLRFGNESVEKAQF